VQPHGIHEAAHDPAHHTSPPPVDAENQTRCPAGVESGVYVCACAYVCVHVFIIGFADLTPFQKSMYSDYKRSHSQKSESSDNKFIDDVE
jgi:hypothetical protein